MDSSTDNMNVAMPDISESIVDGDDEYNEAVDLVNNKNFYQSKQKAESAGDNYNQSLIKLHKVQGNFSSDIHGVHKDYINTVIKEVELKIKAVDLLKEAIDCFEVNSTRL